jgi:hypothetical protein
MLLSGSGGVMGGAAGPNVIKGRIEPIMTNTSKAGVRGVAVLACAAEGLAP